MHPRGRSTAHGCRSRSRCQASERLVCNTQRRGPRAIIAEVPSAVVGHKSRVGVSRVGHDIRSGSTVVCTLQTDLQLTDAALGHTVKPQNDSSATPNRAVRGRSSLRCLQPWLVNSVASVYLASGTTSEAAGSLYAPPRPVYSSRMPLSVVGHALKPQSDSSAIQYATRVRRSTPTHRPIASVGCMADGQSAITVSTSGATELCYHLRISLSDNHLVLAHPRWRRHQNGQLCEGRRRHTHSLCRSVAWWINMLV